MRSLLIALILTAATVAQAGTISVSIPTNAAQDTAALGVVKAANAKTCHKLTLPVTCSDAEAKAKDSDAVIYPLTAAGVNAFYRAKLIDIAREDVAAWRQLKKDAIASAYESNPATAAAIEAAAGVQ